MVTTAALSRDWLRKNGWIAEVVEHRAGNFRHDMFGFADVMAYHPDKSILLVQAYRKGAEKDHEKLTPEKNQFVKLWLASGGKFDHHVWSFDSKGMRNKRKTWHVEIISILAE